MLTVCQRPPVLGPVSRTHFCPHCIAPPERGAHKSVGITAWLKSSSCATSSTSAGLGNDGQDLRTSDVGGITILLDCQFCSI